MTARRPFLAVMVPSAPLLVPAVAGGAAGTDEPLRSLVMQAVRSLLQDAGPAERVTVVGDAPASGLLQGTWDWSGFGVRARGSGSATALPLALALGAWMLDEVGFTGQRSYVGVSAGDDADSCSRLGASLAGAVPLRLLVVGDGSARRSDKAPGHFDARAQDFDDQAVLALNTGDTQGLLDLDPALGRELMVTGRAPWQVLAGAATALQLRSEVLATQAPYGVNYLVARWSTAA